MLPIGEEGHVAVAVAARRIDVQRAADAFVVHRVVVGDGIGEGRDEAVVIRQDDDRRRRLVRLYLELVAVQTDQVGILLLVAQEAVQRALVCAGAHRNDRVNQDLEVRPESVGGVGGDGRRQVSAGGGAHDADVAGVQVPDGGAVAHRPHRPLGVADGQGAVPVGDAVVHERKGDALCVEEFGPGGPFVRIGQDGIAAARTADDGPPGGLFGQIDNELRHAVITQGKGELTGGLGAGGQAGCGHQDGEDDFLHNQTRMIQIMTRLDTQMYEEIRKFCLFLCNT